MLLMCTSNYIKLLSILANRLCTFGAEGETRTRDPILFRDMLYQLSYLGMYYLTAFFTKSRFLKIDERPVVELPFIESKATINLSTNG